MKSEIEILQDRLDDLEIEYNIQPSFTLKILITSLKEKINLLLNEK